MASCANCKKEVGCGCNLKNGVCGSCLGVVHPAIANVQRPQPINAIPRPQVTQSPVQNPQQRTTPSPNRYSNPQINRAYWTK